MLCGTIKINEFQIVEVKAENVGEGADGTHIYEVEVSGRSNLGYPYEFDFQLIDANHTGPGLVAAIMTEVDKRLLANPT